MKMQGLFVWLSVFIMAGAVAYGQDFPTKSIRLIVPVGPGGGSDLIARTVVARIAENLGKAVVVENRPGGGGDVGVEAVAHANPDGHTLILVSATYVVRAGMYKVPYDPIGDFAAVTQVSAAPYLVVTSASLPVMSVSELIAYAKSKPGKINFGSPGNGSLVHLTGELMKVRGGVDMVHVPYKSTGAAFTDLLANQVQLGFFSLPAIIPHMKSDKIRPLAVTGAQRTRAVPELPTVSESGVKDFEVTQWQGVLAPKGTPRPVIERLNRAILALLKQADVVKKLANDGGDVVGSTPEEFDAYVKNEFEKWKQVIKQARIHAE